MPPCRSLIVRVRQRDQSARRAVDRPSASCRTPRPVAHCCSYARAREGRANPGRALGRGAADLFLANSFCSARRRRWPLRSQVRGQLRQTRRSRQTTGRRARHRRAMDQGRQERCEVDAAVVLRVRRQCRAAATSRARVQSCKLPADAGTAGRHREMVADQPAGKAREDRREACRPPGATRPSKWRRSPCHAICFAAFCK